MVPFEFFNYLALLVALLCPLKELAAIWQKLDFIDQVHRVLNVFGDL